MADNELPQGISCADVSHVKYVVQAQAQAAPWTSQAGSTGNVRPARSEHPPRKHA
ncbi:hypothetical protein GCM10009625_06400 [Brachybacterium fresconis]